MKKLFVILALAGMVGSISATAISVANKSAIVSVNGDHKKKKGCSDSTKSCCKDGDKSKCTKGGCCKDKNSTTSKPNN